MIEIKKIPICLPDIPRSWIIAGLGAGLVGLRVFGIDSWTTAALSVIIGYLTGKHIEQAKQAAS